MTTTMNIKGCLRQSRVVVWAVMVAAMIFAIGTVDAAIDHTSSSSAINSTTNDSSSHLSMMLLQEEEQQQEAQEQRQLQKRSSASSSSSSFYGFSLGDTCRCEAPWEALYDGSATQVKTGRFFNYQTTQIHAGTNLVEVEGTFVLPKASAECRRGGGGGNDPSAPRPLQRPFQMRPGTMVTTLNNGNGGQMRSPYNFSNYNNDGNRNLMVADVDDGEEMAPEPEASYEMTTPSLEKGRERRRPQRDLQQPPGVRYYGQSLGTSSGTTACPRNYGGAVRDYSARPFGGTSYYGYGRLLYLEFVLPLTQIFARDHDAFFPNHTHEDTFFNSLL
jgi:hypothetical protein